MALVVNQPAPPSPNNLDAYKLAAAKTGNSTAPPAIAGGIFISSNFTSTGSSTATGSLTVSLTTSTGTSTGSGYGSGSSSGSGSGSNNGGSSLNGGNATTTGAPGSGSSPITPFQGAAGRFVVSAASVFPLGAGVAMLALF